MANSKCIKCITCGRTGTKRDNDLVLCDCCVLTREAKVSACGYGCNMTTDSVALALNDFEQKIAPVIRGLLTENAELKGRLADISADDKISPPCGKLTGATEFYEGYGKDD